MLTVRVSVAVAVEGVPEHENVVSVGRRRHFSRIQRRWKRLLDA